MRQALKEVKELCLSAHQHMNQTSSDHETGLTTMRFLYTMKSPHLPGLFLADGFKETSFIMYLTSGMGI